jgi:Concanavalin A-like lectin/glucanases superfamily/MBG domain/MBG domain (YGX type)/Bacterial Ig domain
MLTFLPAVSEFLRVGLAFALSVVCLAHGFAADPKTQDDTRTVTNAGSITGTLRGSSDKNTTIVAFMLATQPLTGTVVLLDATTGSYRYTPTPNTIPTERDSFTFHVRDSNNRTSNKAGTITLNFSNTVTVTWKVPRHITYGRVHTAGATARVGTIPVPGTYTYDPPLGTVLKAGTHNVEVTFVPDDKNLKDVKMKKPVTVLKAPLTITANASKIYGQPLPIFQATYSGFVNGDTAATAIKGSFRIETTATQTSPVGSYPLFVRRNKASADNYWMRLVEGKIDVTPAPAVINLTNLRHTFNYQTHATTITTSPSGLSFVVTYNGVSDIPRAVGNYTVVARISDPNYAGTASAMLEIVAPSRAIDDDATTSMNQAVSVSVLANDTSANSPLTLLSFEPATHGTASLSGDGQSLIYTPYPGFIGSDSFAYTVRDNAGNTDLGLVYVRVTGPSDLVLYWKFEEPSGYIAHDSLRNHNGSILGSDGNIQNNASRVAGKMGNSLLLDGNNLVISGASPDWQTTPFSFACWIKPTSAFANMSVYTSLFNTLDWENNAGLYFGTLGNSNDVYFMVMNGASQEERKMVSYSEIAVNEWIHLAAVYDGVALRIYRNGLEVASLPASGLTINYSPSWPLLVGQGYQGNLDDVRIYTSALAPSDVQALVGTTTRNTAPVITINGGQIITLGNAANVSGIANDDGLPAANLAYRWSLVNGPATVQFSAVNAPSSQVAFTKPGGYTLRLMAYDGDLSTFADTHVIVDCADDVERGLLVHWKLNENLGSAAIDSSGNNFHSAFYGTPSWGIGTMNGAVELNGTQFGITGDAPALRLDQFTISAWINNTNTVANMGSSYPTILSKLDWANNSGFHFGVLEPDTNTLGFRLMTGTSFFARQEVQASFNEQGKWTHVAAVYDGVSMRLYIDGTLRQSVATGPIRMNQNGFPLILGQEMEGKLDDVRIYDRNLTPSEIQALTLAGLSGNG